MIEVLLCSNLLLLARISYTAFLPYTHHHFSKPAPGPKKITTATSTLQLKSIIAVLLFLFLFLHHYCQHYIITLVNTGGKSRWLLLLFCCKWRCCSFLEWHAGFSCCLVQVLCERPYVEIVWKESVAVYCCIVVFVCVFVCAMPSWVCVFQSVNIFLCLLHWLSVFLCLYFGYPVPMQKNGLPLNLLCLYSCDTNPAMSDIHVDSLILIFRKEQVWVLSCSYASGSIVYFHSPWLLDLHWLSLPTIGQSSNDSREAD